MHPSQNYDLRSRAGALVSDQKSLNSTTLVLTIAHAMDRAPELVCLRLTCIVANSGFAAGETWHVYQGASGSAEFFCIHSKPGLITANVNGPNMFVPNSDGSAVGLITATSWKAELVAVWFALPASV